MDSMGDGLCIFSVLLSFSKQSIAWLDHPRRGIRQGDPLSPILFILCRKGLSHSLNKAEHQSIISGIRFSENGPAIHHLLFADDGLFTCKANQEQCKALVQILKEYEKATSHAVNLTKYAISFGENVDQIGRIRIKELTGILGEEGTGNYLGLPEYFSGSKIDLLTYIQYRLKTRLNGWFARTLSQGGKEVLLKAVALAMPIFAMSCYKLPKYTCENITKAMADFWWNLVEHKRKTHWMSWEKLCLSKDQGGLGFRDIQCFHQTLLAKQA